MGPLVVRLAKDALLIAREARQVGTEQEAARSGEPVVTPDAS